MKTRSIFTLALLLSISTTAWAQEVQEEPGEEVIMEEEYEEEEYSDDEGYSVSSGSVTITVNGDADAYVAGHTDKEKDGTLVVDGPGIPNKVMEEMTDGTVRGVQPYKGFALLGAAYETGINKGTSSDAVLGANEPFKMLKQGGRLSLTFPILGSSGDNMMRANYGKIKLTVGYGEFNLRGKAADELKALDVKTDGSYIHGSLAPTLNLYAGDVPKVYEKGLPAKYVGVEFGPSIGGICENLNKEQKQTLGITDSNCHLTIGAIIRGSLSWLSGGVEFRHHLGESGDRKSENEVILNLGLEIPLSQNEGDLEKDERRNDKDQVPGVKSDSSESEATRAANV